jgi:pSer/pThr/pTyr-binding forkhead associated (FHA) protein
MAKVTFQVLEGVDKGRVFANLPTPVTMGREEGNLLRLNDERVSRFHAKVQQDNDDIILTDLDSTNGTRVNGHVVQIRRLRVGDRIYLGRTHLLFGSSEEIAARMSNLTEATNTQASKAAAAADQGPLTLQASHAPDEPPDQDYAFDLNVNDKATFTNEALILGNRNLPPLPLKLSPSQAARLAEVLDYLHRGLTLATENIQANDESTQVILAYPDWQKVLAIQMLLARYLRAVADPDTMGE